MTWRELLAQLDAARMALSEGTTKEQLFELRIRLRLSHPKTELDAKIPENDSFAKEVIDAYSPYYIAPPPIPKPTEHPLADLFACLPADDSQIQDIVERGEGEGRMVVLKRDTPLIVRPPDLTEVTEEELGK